MPRTAVSSRTLTNVRPRISNSTNNIAAKFIAASSQSLTIASNSSLQLDNTNFTIAGWVFFTLPPTTFDLLAKISVGVREYRLIYSSSRFNFRYNLSGGSAETVVTANNFGEAGAKQWYFIAVKYSLSNQLIEIQVNDGTADSRALVGGLFQSTQTFALARAGGLGVEYLDGLLQSWGIWKRRLTDFELSFLYNHGKALRYVDLRPELVNVVTNNLISWWDLGEASGSRADSTTTANNLTANNSPLADEGNVAISRSLITTQVTRRISVDPIITDTFARADSSTSLGNTESPMYPWVPTGTWGITSSQGANKASGSQKAVIDARVSDCVVEVTCKRVASAMGIMGRNRLRYSSAGSTTYTVVDNSNGSTLATFVGPSWSANQTKTLKLIMMGSNIFCFVDNIFIGSLSSVLNQTDTNHGLYSNSAANSSLFTNFKVY